MRSLGGHLVLCLLSAALLGPSTAFSGHNMDVSCEDEILPIRGMMRLLEAGWKVGELDFEALQAYSQLNKFDNPYATSDRTTGNHSLRDRYARLLRLLPDSQIERFRARVLDMVRRKSGDTQSVVSAKELTAEIPGIEIEENLDWLLPVATLTAGTLQGRPVRVGYFATPEKQITLMIIDPTNPNRERRFAPLDKPIPASQSGIRNGHIFQRSGADYYLDFRSLKIYDMSMLQVVPHELTFSKSNPLRHILQSTTAFNVQDKVRLLTNSFDSGEDPVSENSGSLKIADLEGENTVPKEFLRAHSTLLQSAATFEVDGRVILTYPPRGKDELLRFYDVTDKPFPIATFENEPRSISYNYHYNPLPFSLGGRLLALARYEDLSSYKYHLGVLDLKSKEVIKNVKTGNHDPNFMSTFHPFTMNGKPHAVVNFADGNMILDLTTQEPVWTIENSPSLTFSIYEWNGQKFLAGVGFQTDELKIYELETGLLRAQKPVQWLGAQGIFTFVDNGVPKAILFHQLKSTLVRLAVKEEK